MKHTLFIVSLMSDSRSYVKFGNDDTFIEDPRKHIIVVYIGTHVHTYNYVYIRICVNINVNVCIQATKSTVELVLYTHVCTYIHILVHRK